IGGVPFTATPNVTNRESVREVLFRDLETFTTTIATPVGEGPGIRTDLAFHPTRREILAVGGMDPVTGDLSTVRYRLSLTETLAWKPVDSDDKPITGLDGILKFHPPSDGYIHFGGDQSGFPFFP